MPIFSAEIPLIMAGDSTRTEFATAVTSYDKPTRSAG